MAKVIDKVKNRLAMLTHKGEKKSIAFFVDGPNMLRKEYDFNLTKVKQQLEKFGNMKIGKVFLNQYAPEKLIEAVVNQGFETVIVTSDDIDAPMAAEAMEAIFNSHIDTIAIMTRDGDFQSILLKAKKYGKDTIVVGSEPFSASLRNTADFMLTINQR
jgi:uncharacterized protein (TIGR00288 family)